MTEKEIRFGEKRELGDVISDSFLFLKYELRSMAGIILIYVVPFFILFAYLQVNAQQKMLDSGLFNNPQILMDNPLDFYKNILVIIIYNVFAQCLYIAVIYSYIEVYIKNRKGNFTRSDVTSALFSNSITALGAGILVSIIVFTGLMLFFLPGIYFANTFSIVFIIAIFEKKGLGFALQKSWKLVNKQWWNTFLLNIIALIIIIAIGFLFSIPTMIAGFTNSISGLGQSEITDYPQWYWYLSGLNSVVSSLLYIIPYTFLAFQYFNLEERFKGQSNPQF